MERIARSLIAVVATLVLVATAAPGSQSRMTVVQTRKGKVARRDVSKRLVRVPVQERAQDDDRPSKGKGGAVRVVPRYPVGRGTKGDTKGEGSSKDDGGSKGTGRGQDDVGVPSEPQDPPKDETDRPTDGERPRPPRRPRPNRWPIDIDIVVGGSRDKDERKDEKRDKDEKDDAKDEEPDEEEVDSDRIAEERPSDNAPAAPRPLKYDADALRGLADSLLESGRVSAALKVIGLLKEQEYHAYAGDLGVEVAHLEPASLPQADRAFGAPLFDPADIVRVAKKDKKKDKKKEKEKENADESRELSWEDSFEANADTLLALSTELEALERIPERERNKKQRDRIEALRGELDASSEQLEVLVDGFTRDLGRKDPRVKRLRASDDLMQEIGGLGGGIVGAFTLLAKDRYWIVIVKPATVRAFSTPVDAASLEAKVLEFRKTLRSPKRDPRPLARELYGILVEPAASELAAARTVLWSFDGVLRYVPVSALHDGTGYLVDRFSSALFTRASIDALRETPQRPWSGIGLGVARKVADYRPLPAVADELRGIFREESATDEAGAVAGQVLLDDQFTEQALRTTLGQAHAVVHIATHFQLAPTGARDSVLLLGDGSLVSVDEIRDMKRAFRGIELLTLSACDTAAIGPDRDGKEVESFATIAQEEGAQAVLATLWSVDDRSTSALMQAFYRLRDERPGMSKAEAMREVQRMMIRGDLAVGSASQANRILVHDEGDASGQPAFVADPQAPFAHPYYWAPFVLIGNLR